MYTIIGIISAIMVVMSRHQEALSRSYFRFLKYANPSFCKMKSNPASINSVISSY
jgi:hypothetical protein